MNKRNLEEILQNRYALEGQITSMRASEIIVVLNTLSGLADVAKTLRQIENEFLRGAFDARKSGDEAEAVRIESERQSFWDRMSSEYFPKLRNNSAFYADAGFVDETTALYNLITRLVEVTSDMGVALDFFDDEYMPFSYYGTLGAKRLDDLRGKFIFGNPSPEDDVEAGIDVGLEQPLLDELQRELRDDASPQRAFMYVVARNPRRVFLLGQKYWLGTSRRGGLELPFASDISADGEQPYDFISVEDKTSVKGNGDDLRETYECDGDFKAALDLEVRIIPRLEVTLDIYQITPQDAMRIIEADNTFDDTDSEEIVSAQFAPVGDLYDGNQIQHPNATLYLFRSDPRTGRIQFLMCKRRSDRRWTTPGGRKDRSDVNDFATMKREFREETGHRLPRLDRVNKLSYNGHTAVYVAALDSRPDALGEPLRLKPGHDNEMIDLRWFDIASVADYLWRGKCSYIAPRSRESTKEILDEVLQSHFI